VAVDSSGVATLPAAVSNSLAVGSHTINATYTSSSAGFSNSVATRIFSVSPVPPSVGISAGNASLTVSAGGSVTDTLTFTPAGGYTGTLQLSCSGLPQNASCSFQPASVTLTASGGAQTTQLAIQTAGNAAHLRLLPWDNSMEPAAVFWLPGLFLLRVTRRRSRRAKGSVAVVVLTWIGCVAVLGGCGGGGSTTQTTPPAGPVTPSGTSTVTVTASASGSSVQVVTLKLTVQ
jgi:hypothetical protein